MTTTTTTAIIEKRKQFSLAKLLLEGRAFLALILIIVVFSLLSRNYFTVENVLIMSSHVAIYALLGMGMLTGKYKKDQPAPAGSRVTHPDIGSWMKDDYFSDVNFAKVEKLQQVADRHGISMVHLSLAWLLSVPGISSARSFATAFMTARAFGMSVP